VPDKDLIAVVCHANYCRSPVAEYLLEYYLKDKYKYISAGIFPITTIGMDPRSHKYLLSKNIKVDLHKPQKITRDIMNKSKIIFALDYLILQELNSNFKKFKNKIKILNFQNPKINLTDPYKFNDSEYEEIMNNIDLVIQNIDI